MKASSVIAKFFTAQELAQIMARLEAEPGDLLLFVADKPNVVAASLGALRQHLAERLGLIPDGLYHFLWVVDFPLLEYDQEEGRYQAMHHPFTAPREDDLPLLESEPGQVRARAYDLVLNGWRSAAAASGSTAGMSRRRCLTSSVSAARKLRKKFGFMLEAFEYGTRRTEALPSALTA